MTATLINSSSLGFSTMTDSEDKSEENTTLTELKTLMSATLAEFKNDFLRHIDESIAQVYRDFDVEDQSEHEHDDGSAEVEARIDSLSRLQSKPQNLLRQVLGAQNSSCLQSNSLLQRKHLQPLTRTCAISSWTSSRRNFPRRNWHKFKKNT